MIYLDNSATTPLIPEAIAGMNKAMECFANPSSLHSFGNSAEHLKEDARKAIASALGIRSNSHTVIFTSGGTEANNLAVLGIARAKKYKNPKIIITDSEHPCIMEPVRSLENEGFKVAYIKTKGGRLDISSFENEMDENTVLVSSMLVNNETGALYDIKRLFSIAKEINPNVICHTDAVQAFTKVKFTVSSIGADMITLSSHKIHGPKGSGALIISNKLLISKKLSPIIIGGGQEGGIRSGTENTVGICGFGAAAEAAFKNIDKDIEYTGTLRNYLVESLPESVKLNEGTKTAPHIVNITLPDIKSETMLHYLSSFGIYVSSGSACSSHGKHGSYVLAAFGLTPHEADCSIRISLSRLNTRDDIDELIKALKQGIDSLVRIKQ